MTERDAHATAVTDLLGLVAYGELTAFERLAADAGTSPTLDGKAELAGMATAEFGHFRMVRARLADLGVEPTEAMAPFREAVDTFHEQTRPSDWLESLVKAYIGDTLAADFHREAARFLDPDSRAVVEAVLQDMGQAAFVVEHVRAAISADPKVAGRLALWGRRIVGEALTQAQQVATRRASLAALLSGALGTPGADGAAGSGAGGQGPEAMFDRLTVAHGKRMAELGLRA